MRISAATACVCATLIAEMPQQAIAAPPPAAAPAETSPAAKPAAIVLPAATVPEPAVPESAPPEKAAAPLPAAIAPEAASLLPVAPLTSTAVAPPEVAAPAPLPRPIAASAAPQTVALSVAENEAIAAASRKALNPAIAPPIEAEPELTNAEETLIAVTLEQLSPDPNPLALPTQPAEVEPQQVVAVTLEEALELARRNSQALRVAALELERAQAAFREARAADLPNVAAGADLTLQRSAAAGDTSAAALLGGSLEVNYDLFTSGRRSALIAAAEQQIRAQELQVEVIADSIELDVVNAYYALQEADQQVRIADAALAEAELSLRDAAASELAGVGNRFDRLQSEVDVANSRQALILALGDQQTARRQLRQQLNLAETLNVAAADPVRFAGIWSPSLEESIVLAYRNRAELEQQLVQREISQQQRRAALADLGPQVSLFASYGLQDTLTQSEGFNDDLQLGARLQMNLFDGGAARARADQEAANVAIAETQFSDLRSQIRLEVEQAYLALQSNLANAETATQAVDTAAEALRLARLRFQAGVGTQADVSRSQTELVRAEGNRLQTILGYNRALALLQRVVSPFTDRTAQTATDGRSPSSYAAAPQAGWTSPASR